MSASSPVGSIFDLSVSPRQSSHLHTKGKGVELLHTVRQTKWAVTKARGEVPSLFTVLNGISHCSNVEKKLCSLKKNLWHQATSCLDLDVHERYTWNRNNLSLPWILSLYFKSSLFTCLKFFSTIGKTFYQKRDQYCALGLKRLWD